MKKHRKIDELIQQLEQLLNDEAPTGILRLSDKLLNRVKGGYGDNNNSCQNGSCGATDMYNNACTNGSCTSVHGMGNSSCSNNICS